MFWNLEIEFLYSRVFSEEIGIGHDSGSCTGRNPEYNKKRLPMGNDKIELQKTIDKLWYQRNYLKCVVDTVWNSNCE